MKIFTVGGSLAEAQMFELLTNINDHANFGLEEGYHVINVLDKTLSEFQKRSSFSYDKEYFDPSKYSEQELHFMNGRPEMCIGQTSPITRFSTTWERGMITHSVVSKPRDRSSILPPE